MNQFRIRMPVLVRVSIPALNIMTKKQVGEERIYSAYTSTLLLITKGSQDRNLHRAGSWKQELMQRPWRVPLTGLLPLSCSAFFLPSFLPFFLSFLLSFFLSFFLRIIYMLYTVAVFRHNRREHQIPLQMVVSQHAVSGN